MIEFKGPSSIIQAYALADVGRFLKANFPDSRAILIARNLTPEMRDLFISRYWGGLFDEAEVDELVSFLKDYRAPIISSS
jgi:hypothetical protein